MNQGDYIKGLMKERHLTSAYLSKKIGISYSSFSTKLHGHRPFKRREIEILLNELDMTYEEVFKTKEVKIRNTDEHIIIMDGKRLVVPKEKADKLKEVLAVIEEENLGYVDDGEEFNDLAHNISGFCENFDTEEYKLFKKERAEKKAREEKANGDDKNKSKLP